MATFALVWLMGAAVALAYAAVAQDVDFWDAWRGRTLVGSMIRECPD